MSILTAATAAENWLGQYAIQPLLILMLGIFVGKVLEQVVLFILAESNAERKGFVFSAYLLKWIVYVAALLWALASVGVLRIMLWILLFAALILAALSAVLGLREFVPNFLSYHAVQARYKPGAKLKSKAFEGTVASVQLTDTHVTTKAGDDIYIPNRTMKSL